MVIGDAQRDLIGLAAVQRERGEPHLQVAPAQVQGQRLVESAVGRAGLIVTHANQEKPRPVVEIHFHCVAQHALRYRKRIGQQQRDVLRRHRRHGRLERRQIKDQLAGGRDRRQRRRVIHPVDRDHKRAGLVDQISRAGQAAGPLS